MLLLCHSSIIYPFFNVPSQHTDHMIQKLLGPLSVDGNTQMVLATALVVQGKWAKEFTAWSMTPFYTSKGEKVEKLKVREWQSFLNSAWLISLCHIRHVACDS